MQQLLLGTLPCNECAGRFILISPFHENQSFYPILFFVCILSCKNKTQNIDGLFIYQWRYPITYMILSYIFLLRGTGIVLVLFYIYLIVPYTPAFLHSFLLLVTVVKGIGPKHQTYFYSLVLELFFCYSISYPIVPHAPAFLYSSW